MITSANVFVAEGTFGVLDAGEIPIQAVEWSNGLADVMSHGAIIVTGIHTGYIRVAASVQDAPPETDEGAHWEEAVEVSVHAPHGQLRIESLDHGPLDALPVLSAAGAGWYRLRVCARGRETHPDGAEMQPVEDYWLVAWPSARLDTKIIRSSRRIEDSLRRNTARPNSKAAGARTVPQEAENDRKRREQQRQRLMRGGDPPE